MEGMGAEEEMGEEMGNEGRDEGAEREVGMNEGGTGNEEGRVGYGLGEDNKKEEVRRGEGVKKGAIGMTWAGEWTGEGTGVGWVGAEMMEGEAYVEGGQTGSGAEEAIGEGSTGDWMAVVMVWELWVW